MIKQFTARSFDNQELPLDQIEEAYFNTIEECKKWCDMERLRYGSPDYEMDLNEIHFEIHHSKGAGTYLVSDTGDGITTDWYEVVHSQEDMPSVNPWWSINNIPAELVESMMD